jgi:dihydrofolate reductase
MKLTTTVQVSVDGVMQGPCGPEEDERGRFERGGWAHFDDEASTVMDEIYQRADAFLFGRRTYEIFAGSWGLWADPGDSPIWTALNTLPKYVASTQLTDPRWATTTDLSGDVAAAVGEAESQARTRTAGSLWSSARARGCSPTPAQTQRLTWVDSRVTPKGVTIQVYWPTGRPRYATATM